MHAVTSARIAIHGIGSNYIARLFPIEVGVSLSVRKYNFCDPELLSEPVIIIGAGTGIFPLMGFKQG